uniref:Uncharacterized protein n=2 Tax=Lepeophtheirus salmonis TaxID=72036 RepID=A0A0K2V0A3_LEPSM
MFGFALSFKGVHPNVRRLMVVAVLQIIGWSFLAKIGTIRKNIGSNQRQRKKRALASQSEDPLINLFSSVNPYFILESISKFD